MYCAGWPVLQSNLPAQSLKLRGVWRSLHLNQVTFVHTLLRIRDSVLQSAVIGQQQQAFAVPVQAPGRIDGWDIYVGSQGWARISRTLSRRELTQNAPGLVEREQQNGSGPLRHP